MSPIDFLPILLENIHIYVILLIIFTLLYLPVIRRTVYNVFDPFLIILVGSVFGTTLVFYMYWTNLIEDVYFFSFVSTELSFIFSIMLFSKSRSTALRTFEISSNRSFFRPRLVRYKLIFFISCALYFFTTILIYHINGIPILKVSRLGGFVGSGGLGIIERINDVSIMLATISMFIIYKCRGSNFSLYKIVIFLASIIMLITFLLSGAKGKILIFSTAWFFSVFVFNLYDSKPSFFNGRNGVISLFFFIIFALSVISMSSKGSFIDIIGALAFRVVNFGDVFIWAYLDNTIEELSGSDWFYGLFGGFLSVFRLLSPNDIYMPIGQQLPLIIYPELDYISGPNAKHNIVFYHYFGGYAFLFSFFVGYIISFVRYDLFNKILYKHGSFGVMLYYLIYWSLGVMSVDFDYSLSLLASVILVFPIIFFLTVLFDVNYSRGKKV
ncbi:oligosaccharide repeat unit polymerase [Vibrio cholerae]|uniref:O-antigen polymerase n=1 Tax=Vibrio cholerae TaxID=666 RepID=UPI0018F07589|nr:O-antigen polymerase [Vibrio cholerae]MBJ6879713.1 oligosaccharide repeat unit polymerase [Vibrio cholerae]MBJ6883396.1 oligosaccharide repeat unit polymerase [Vibrio cholerae]MBJ6890755.1 oligosaccharide repeat unit polymerase [Vibrio cholerae]